MSPAEANRLFYRDNARDYDATEECVVERRYQERLRGALSEVLERLGPNPRALDACGGSGNIGLALAERGITPVVVDVSAEMVEIWQEKALRLGIDDPEVHVRPVEDFFEADGREWDLITFCSALHHLSDPAAVLRQAARHLAPGGMIFTIFDPTGAGRSAAVLRKADWALHMLVTDPRGFASLGLNAVRRGSQADAPEAYVGRIAELHATKGIDDEALARALTSEGLTIVTHDRYVDARLALTRALFRAANRPSAFRLVARREAQAIT